MSVRVTESAYTNAHTHKCTLSTQTLIRAHTEAETYTEKESYLYTNTQIPDNIGTDRRLRKQLIHQMTRLALSPRI